MSTLLRRTLPALIALAVLPLLAAPATASVPARVAVPTAGEGVSCVSTRACTPAYGGALMTTSGNSCTAGLPVRTRPAGGTPGTPSCRRCCGSGALYVG